MRRGNNLKRDDVKVGIENLSCDEVRRLVKRDDITEEQIWRSQTEKWKEKWRDK